MTILVPQCSNQCCYQSFSHVSTFTLFPCELSLLEKVSDMTAKLVVLSLVGHSMSNQHKKILTLSDLNETWFVHSV